MSSSSPELDFDQTGPRAGERFPDLALPAQDGQLVDLHRARAGRRALVLFHRSASWWPFCKTQLVELQRSLPDYERAGIAVFAISYDAVDVLSAFAGKHGITYPLLSDADSAVIRRLGLLHEDVVAGVGISSGPLRPDQVGMAYPGVFLLDEQGVVTSKRFFASFRQRETGVALLEQGFGVAATEFGAVAEGGSEGVRVRASLDSDTYRPFQRLWLTLQVAVANELHIYGRPIPDGYTPLSVEVAPMEGLTVGEPEWPPPHPFRIDGLDEQFMVYEGAVALALPITFGTRDAGDLTLHITVRYQACSSTDCLMPASVALELPVRAAALVT